MTPLAEATDIRSRVYGAESALAERAVILLTKLSRSVIHPYVMFGSSVNLVRNTITDLTIEDFRNDQDGPFLITRVRVMSLASLTAAAATAPFSNVSLQMYDLEGHHQLQKDPVLLPVLMGIADNTWTLDRPYVLDRRSALLIQATEENIAATTDIYLSVMGEVVLGEMSGREVEEAIGLGLYPLAGRQASLWDYFLLMGKLFGNTPPKLKGEADDLLYDLRMRVAVLRQKLRDADYVAYVLEDGAVDLTQNALTLLTRERFRNDQGGPLAIHRVRTFVTGGLAAAASGAVLDNISFLMQSVDERIDLIRTSTPVIGPCLFSREDNTWTLDHPHVLRQNGSLQVDLTENNVNATTDVFVSFIGEAVRGVDHNDLRAAVALGLYPLMDRGVG